VFTGNMLHEPLDLFTARAYMPAKEVSRDVVGKSLDAQLVQKATVVQAPVTVSHESKFRVMHEINASFL
jgi:hypothetical protein